MEASSLRLLAEQHASRNIDTATYRTRRRALIDAIERGDAEIVRGVHTSDAPAPPSTSRTWPWPRTIAVVALASSVVALTAALIGRDADSARDVEPSAAIEVNAPRQLISPAQGMVHEFLTHRDFSAPALDAFSERWSALPRGDRNAARGTDWFAGLTRSLHDEIRTQIALAELGTTAPAREQVARLRAFARKVSVPLDEETLAAPSERLSADAEVAARQHIGGEQWLAIQSADRLTLQLFAVNALEHVARLMTRYDTLDMHVLTGSAGAPRYRVVHGSFDDVEQAKAAYDQLPEDIRALSNGAIVKSIAALRDDLSAPPTAAGPATSARPSPPANGHAFTLQLFATANAANARALIDAFPNLELDSATVPDSPSPHRVVLGRYDNVDAARAARKALPPELLSRVGLPLIKQRASLGLR